MKEQQLLDRVMAEITDPRRLNSRRERSYPRVVKRARHNSYPVKKPGDHRIRHDAPVTIKRVNFSSLDHHMATTIPTRRC